MTISEEKMVRYERIRHEFLDALQEIEAEAYPDPWSRQMFSQEITNATSNFYVAVLGAEIIAYGGFWFLLDEAHITKVTVAHAWRGKGYGRALMHFLLSEAEAKSAATVRLEVRESNVGAQRLYQQLGFREVGRRKDYYTRCRETAVVMVKYLKEAREGE